MTESSPVLASTVRLARGLIAIEFAVAVAVAVYAGFHDFNDVIVGSPQAVPIKIAASCIAAEPSAPCNVSVLELNPGRYHLGTTTASTGLTVTLATPSPERARYFLLTLSQPAKLQLDVRPRVAGVAAEPVEVDNVSGRVVTTIAGSGSTTLTFVSNVEADRTPILIDELGVFDDSRGLLSDIRPLFGAIPPPRYHGTLVPRGVARLCLFTVIAAPLVPFMLLKRINPWVLGVLCFSLCLLDLAILYSPYSARDLRTFYAAGALQDRAGTNLNGGLWQGFRLLQGKGLTLVDGVVPWERMPGYGLFCALAGALFGHRTLLDVAMSTVLLQTIFYSAALSAFIWAAGPLYSPAAVWAVGLLIAWLPKQLGLTQVDAIIAPAALLILAALCVRLKVSRQGLEVPKAVDLAVHAAFALWFVLRPDVLPGWLFVSLFLHRKDWRRLLIPAALFLVIGVAWGAYRARHNREFALTTSAGASLFCGLWEVPSRFRPAMACTDETYFDWIERNTPYQPQTSAASSFATREVVKFWVTYPGHFVVMVYHKMMQALDGDVWPGYPTQLQVFVFGAVRRYWLVVALLTVIALCVAIGYQRERTLLLAWPLLFNAPLFWIMFASLGRFYSGVGVALLVAAIPPLFERTFYASMVARPWRTLSVLACAGLFASIAWPFHEWLLRNDTFHYWTPFLDPAGSRLSAFK